MNPKPPRISVIANYPRIQPAYGYWTKVIRNNNWIQQDEMDWLEEYTTGRVAIGHTWFYFEYEKDALFFKLRYTETP